MTYFCPECYKDVSKPTEEVVSCDRQGDKFIMYLCPTCGEEIVESYECPIHGTDAPDGYGNCAKC